MIFLRPIQKSDLDDLVELAALSGVGMTNFPKERKELAENIERSIHSFEKEVQEPGEELYLFALEDREKKKMVGISAIFAMTGVRYFFKKEVLYVDSRLEGICKRLCLLTNISYLHATSELCSLFLHPDARKHGLGKLLSLGRFLYIANFPKRVTNLIYADLRGVIENGKSVFWDGIGRHFLDVEFTEALELLKNKKCIPDFLPKYPIYISLLPKEVQECIGKIHPQTKGAEKLLLEEGFTTTDEVDIFDGGPKMCAQKQNITTIKESRLVKVGKIGGKIGDVTDSATFLIANTKKDFRACLGTVPGAVSFLDQESVIITEETAEMLDCRIQDTLRIRSLS